MSEQERWDENYRLARDFAREPAWEDANDLAWGELEGWDDYEEEAA